MIQLHHTPPLIKACYPSLIWETNVDNTVYLTFDDGPHPEITPWVVEQLEKHEAKGTFFCVGDNIRKHQSVAELLSDHGHRLGNHTFNHLKGWKTKNDDYLQNVKLCETEISKFVKTENKIFRPPYGRISRAQISLLKNDYDIFMWSHLAWDFSKKLNIGRAIKKLKQAKSGSIVVFHDSPKSFENLKQILPEILGYYSERGFNLKAL